MPKKKSKKSSNDIARPSTVGRGKRVPKQDGVVAPYKKDGIWLQNSDSLSCYSQWGAPTVIVSDGGYGVLGFDGDTSDHLDLPDWYEPHIRSWSEFATPQTTLWFWNSEIGWSVVHPILEKYGWRYQNCNVWNKGKAHIAGNVNTKMIRRFPVVSEVCVQYTFEASVNGVPLKRWLRSEWQRTGLTLRRANDACGVRDVAVRKYLDQGHLWYFPPPERFEQMQAYANEHGDPLGRPYFSLDGKRPAAASDWAKMRAKFYCPHGFTNIWERPPLKGSERVTTPDGKAAHLNQKPLDLMRMIIQASSDKGDLVWEPFGGLFSASYASAQLQRRAVSAEIDSDYCAVGMQRFKTIEEPEHEPPSLFSIET